MHGHPGTVENHVFYSLGRLDLEQRQTRLQDVPMRTKLPPLDLSDWSRAATTDNDRNDDFLEEKDNNMQRSTQRPLPTPALDRQTILEGITKPLIAQNVWDQLTGNEFEEPWVVDALAKTGYKMATEHDDNGWVAWKDRLPRHLDNSAGTDDDPFVCTGTALRESFGSEVPLIKSVSILPISPVEIKDLMMDSSRVQSYNSMSLGRKDIWTCPQRPSDPSDSSHQETKIVRNLVQLPVANKKVESVALLHSRKLDNGSHLLISRAAGGPKYASADDKIARTYILLGVNLFEPIANSPNECRMTAVTHVYQPGIPLMLAGKVGVKSAKNFIQGIRSLSVPTQ